MKLYKYIICGGLALTLTLSSCESWLEVEPNDTRTTDYFYTTPNEMEQALIGIYNGLPIIHGCCRKFVRTMLG